MQSCKHIFHCSIKSRLHLSLNNRHLLLRSMSATTNPDSKTKGNSKTSSGSLENECQNIKERLINEAMNKPSLSRRQRLKLAVRDYGATVMIFHISLGLASLAFFYLAISSDLDMVSLVQKLPWLGPKLSESALGVEASTFVVAYAVHKVFAPVRISVTLAVTPIIVRALRARGIIKRP